jgi:pimeloyl-ACP methyl ester carboxylesterase
MPWPEAPAERERARAEQPLVIAAPEGELVALYTPPSADTPAAGICTVHLTRPRSHRNRNWVRGARWLAARGFAACRFDYHGTGDSGGASTFLDPSAPYRSDVVAVLRALRDRFDHRRFVLSGSCFDARTALSALLDEPGSIAGVAFVSAPVMPLEAMRELRNVRRSWGDVLQAVARPDNWRRLADPELWRAVETRLRGAGGGAGAEAEPGPGDAPELDPQFLASFRALIASTARALFLYGEQDQEFHTFEPVLRRLLPGLDAGARARLEVEVWPGTVHDGFLELERQRRIVERVLEWIATFHPVPETGPAGAGRRAVPGEERA